MPTHNNTKGLVRAFDVRSGKELWRFDTIPRPGEFGNETWENNSWAENGNTGVWAHMTVDEELGTRLRAGGDAVVRLLRRPSPRQQPVRREPRRARSQDRPAQVALPVRPSSDLELGHDVGADPLRHQRQRPPRQGGVGRLQAGLALRVRSRHRAAGVADRGEAGAAVRRAGREDRRRPSRSRRTPCNTPATSSRCRTTSSISRPSCARRRSTISSATRWWSRRLRPACSATSRAPSGRSSPAPRPTGRASATTRIRTPPSCRPAIRRACGRSCSRPVSSPTSGMCRASPASSSARYSAPATAAPPARRRPRHGRASRAPTRRPRMRRRPPAASAA